ncbi:MAG: YigZ family protein [Clostridiales bacterium]|nr:YigZ family protein [Clostridiales bacterium]
MTEYRTAAKEAAAEFTERRSRFIGYAKPVKTEREALSFLGETRAKHWDAAHNVYAYSLREGQIRRYSDDGEPQGTAGIPTLDVLLKSGVTDVAVVVTRYFGGVLLGTGGLVRAYSHAASLALEQAGIVTMKPCLTAEVRCDYSQYGRLASLIPESGGAVDDTVFTDTVTVLFHIGESDLEPFRRKLADFTGGQRDAAVTGKKYFRIL